MPRSNYGKWSFGSAIVMFVLLIAGSFLSQYINGLVLNEDTVYKYSISRSILQMLLQGGFAAGISALLNGLISIFNQKDRGGLVIISTIFGSAATLYFIVDLIFL